jgi:polyamine oxidase
MPATVLRPLPARATLVSRWCGDADFGGAYSYLRPGGTPADRDALGAEVAPGLVLAGEHTWARHPGTLHGAIFSGERAAGLLTASTQRGPVVVVGAGLAGLTAAGRLRDAGRAVTVLDAAAEPGGRARSDTTLGGALPLGGAWLHGVDGHPLAGELALRAWTWDAPRLLPGGRVATARQLAEVQPLRAALEAALDAQVAGRADRSVADALLRVDPLSQPADADLQVLLHSGLRLDCECLVSAPMARLSTRHRFEPYFLPGGDHQIVGGLPEAIARRAAGLDLRLSQRVVALEHGADGGWTLRCEGGAAFAAAQVVCAAPLTALRNGRIAVRPGLPAAVHQHLQRLELGPVAKLFVAFDAAWWAPAPGLVIAGDTALPLWSDVSALAGRPVLCAFASGAAARRLEAMDDAQRAAFADAALASAWAST